ncbi:MAG TPA: endonuclease/exonuclease/phosphatase family protein, partial [Nitrospira sp.]|nr:endonuclease/exonuclease/phosphatase family protein [Nitrospira sp.]
MRLKVATVNLSKGIDRWGERMPLVSAELVKALPDIVGFQEVDLRIDQGNWLCRRVNDLRAFHVDTETEYSIHHMANPRDNASIEALAIMTRLPMVEHEGLDYLVRQRVAHRARVDVGDGRYVDFVNTHFHHIKDAQGDKMRETQTTKLLRWLEKAQPRVPTIVVGDFNSEPPSHVVKLIKEQFRSAYEVSHGKEADSTRGGWWRPQPGESGGALDYIFVSRDVNVLEAAFFCDQPSADDATLFPSDHVGV